MKDKLELTWREVLDAYAPHNTANTISEYLAVVKIAGYNYFTWNGLVYHLSSNEKGLSCESTGLRSVNIK